MNKTFSYFRSELAALSLGITCTSLLAGDLTGGESVPEVPTPAEAAGLVAAEMQERKSRREAAIAAVWSVPSLQEWESPGADRSTIMRRVAPPPASPPAPPAEGTADVQFPPPDWEGKPRRVHTISIHAKVFDHAVSKITWRDADGTSWQALSNVNFNHFSQVTSIKSPEGVWFLLPFVENIDSARELELAGLAAAAGFVHEPRTPPPGVDFTPDVPEYVVFAESESDVPEALVLELDLLHAHYADNREILAARYERNKVLNEARRAWRKANPPEPRDTVINFWVRP